jgi:hypothetical protein
MLADPLTARELEEESTVEAAVGAEIDVLDDGRLAQPGLAQAAGEPLVLARSRAPGSRGSRSIAGSSDQRKALSITAPLTAMTMHFRPLQITPPVTQ